LPTPESDSPTRSSAKGYLIAVLTTAVLTLSGSWAVGIKADVQAAVMEKRELAERVVALETMQRIYLDTMRDLRDDIRALRNDFAALREQEAKKP